MKKDTIIDTVNEFSADIDLDELFEKLVFVEKVEKGLAQLEEGKTVFHENVKSIVEKWHH